MTRRRFARLPVLAGITAVPVIFIAALVSARLEAALPSMQPPPVTGIAHVAFLTSDLAAARRFYHGVLGFDEVFDIKLPDSDRSVSFFKVNDHQYVELYPESGGPNENHLLNIALQTPNVRSMHSYLESRGGLRDIANVHRTLTGDLGFSVTDPNGHVIQFVQYLSGSKTAQTQGKDLSSRRISTEIIHAGIIVTNRDAEDAFYKRDLGFDVMWYGGMKDTVVNWVDMRVNHGQNWIEYMLGVHDLSQHTLGVNHHFALGVPSVTNAAQVASSRGYKPVKPQIGRDGKWQLNLYDPDQTRVELMEPKPVRTPCCSPMHLAAN